MKVVDCKLVCFLYADTTGQMLQEPSLNRQAKQTIKRPEDGVLPLGKQTLQVPQRQAPLTDNLYWHHGKGAGRPATSAVNKASEAFTLRGVKTIDVHIVTSGGRKAVKTWLHLEASLLAVFRTRYFDLPVFNKKTGSVRYAEDVTLFRRRALEKVLLRFGD
jgi:hypothetical protein